MYRIISKFLFLSLLGFILAPSTSFAVPSFARQTGMDCAACHTSFPELTPFGREFKLNGYTLGERQLLPLAAMMQFSMTHIATNHDNAGNAIMKRENAPQFDVLALFAAGKLNDHAGMFVQWTYSNNSETDAETGAIRHHSGIDNTDIRVVGNHDVFGKSLVFGLNLNNNPTVQDVWNSTPAWGYPFNGPNLANTPGPAFATMIDGGLSQAVAGLGGYFWYDRHLYGELSFYGTADKAFRLLSEGSWHKASGPYLDGRNNPYWRLAWNEDWGSHSLMVGTYGMRVDIFPDPTNRNGPTDRYTDTALDAQYQYLSDPHIFTLQTTYIHEKQDYKASFDATCTAGPCNPHNHLNTFKAKGSYLYDRKYGASLAYFNTTGSNDAIAFSTGDNLVTKPDNQGYVAEIDYNPWTFARVALQYTKYTKWDGSRQMDNLGLKPGDRDTLFLSTWFAF
jgi:hypothetical protein